MGEKSATEKAIIEALQIRDVWQRRQSLQYPQPKSNEHGPSSTPTTQIGFTQMSNMYGSDSPKNTDESPRYPKYDRDRTHN